MQSEEAVVGPLFGTSEPPPQPRKSERESKDPRAADVTACHRASLRDMFRVPSRHSGAQREGTPCVKRLSERLPG